MSKPPPRVKFGLQALDNLNEPVAPCLTLHLPFLITDVARGSLVCNWLMLHDVDCSSTHDCQCVEIVRGHHTSSSDSEAPSCR